MTPEQFCYWLQGYSELGGPTPLPEQWAMIREHLALVFKKETPTITLRTNTSRPLTIDELIDRASTPAPLRENPYYTRPAPYHGQITEVTC